MVKHIGNMMTLDEAIEHCLDKSCGVSQCACEHRQLANWLIELRQLKETTLTEQDINKYHKTRKKLAEQSKTPEGRAKYEQVAERMREQIASEDLREVVRNELLKYSGEKYWKAPWVVDSTGEAHPLHFAKLGAQWQRERMMKDAISGVIFGSRYFRQKNISLTNLSEEQYDKLKDFGERVKVIIIKE